MNFPLPNLLMVKEPFSVARVNLRKIESLAVKTLIVVLTSFEFDELSATDPLTE